MNRVENMDYGRFSLIAQCLLDSKWIFAKTMPAHPHWYTLRKDWAHSKLVSFDEVVQFIRNHHYPERFYTKTMQRLNINDMKYWSMGAPLEQTILINRAVIENALCPYDLIADNYESIHSDKESDLENREVIKMIDYQGESVLDIGSGTGLFLDYVDCVANYTACDPSHRMSDILEMKYPDVKVVRSRFEEFHSGEKYDLIISLFGSPSYVSPVALKRIRSMLSAGGRFFLMLYAPGYTPITYIKSGVKTKHHQYEPLGIGESQTRFGNFIILQGGSEQ